jgi:two-component system chemotaxis sensor kinase CheA
MSNDFDMSQYLGIFLDEVEEQLQVLDESIIILEQEKDNVEVINKIFRAAHTLKGSSASMGYDNMAKLTHAMENVLDRLRHHDIEVTTETINLLLEALDNLQNLKNAIINNEEENIDVQELIKNLKKMAEGKVASEKAKVETMIKETATEIIIEDSGKPEAVNSSIELNDIEKNLVNEALIKGYNTYHVIVEIEKDCIMKGPRAYIVFNNLKDIAEVIKTVPTVQEIEEEKFENSFELVVISKEEIGTIRNIVKSVSEISEATVMPINFDYESSEPVAAAMSNQKAEAEVIEVASDKNKDNKLEVKENTPAALKVNQTVRVDVQRLENLMNLVGELVIDRTRLLDVNSGLKTEVGSVEMIDTLEEVSVHIGRITTDLQEEIMKARMFPIEQVFNRFPRMVRDVAQKANKEVEFIVEGRETELDRTVIEEIGDPLIHLLRNAIDHGIETPEEREALGKPIQGTVKLKAFHQENQIIITVEDDGKGMDVEALKRKAVERGLMSMETATRLSNREALNIIFLPGFSTAKVISDVSGRGVGMDIVRTHIEKINGIIDIDTVLGKGTRFTIKLPLTLAINKSLLVYMEENVYAFPLSNVVEIVNVDKASIQKISRKSVVLLRGEVLPLVQLKEILDHVEAEELPERFPVVVCAISERRVGFVVDALLGEQEIVIKSLGEYIGQVSGLAGATIMGDGKVALILDVRGLIGQTGVDTYALAN